MKLIATTVEQSERLLKLGVKPKIADMYYLFIGDVETGKRHYDLLSLDDYLRKRMSSDDIPAWSLTALLDLMPIEIQTKTNFFTLKIDRERNGLYNISYEPFLIRDLYLISFASKELIDAAVEMIEWLIINKHLKV